MRRVAAAFWIALLLVPSAAVRGEDLLPWDGREVAELAAQLRTQVAAAAEAADTSMPQSSLAQHSMRSRARKLLTELLEVAEQLETQLAQVQGPDRTKRTFDLVYERAEPARRFMEEEKPTRKLRALFLDADLTLKRLTRFYGAPTPGLATE